VRPQGLGKYKISPYRVTNRQPSGLQPSAFTSLRRAKIISLAGHSIPPFLNDVMITGNVQNKSHFDREPASCLGKTPRSLYITLIHICSLRGFVLSAENNCPLYWDRKWKLLRSTTSAYTSWWHAWPASLFPNIRLLSWFSVHTNTDKDIHVISFHNYTRFELFGTVQRELARNTTVGGGSAVLSPPSTALHSVASGKLHIECIMTAEKKGGANRLSATQKNWRSNMSTFLSYERQLG
jgi:hypothetical protein